MKSKNSLEQKVRFDIIRYSNCWEDSEVLIKAINLKKNCRYLSIASSGDNSLSLLTGSPSLVLAVDLSIPQIACTELRKIVIKTFSYKEMLEFLGIIKSEKRINKYNKIRDKLNSDTRNYWDSNRKLIESGIIHAGKFEKYFRIFRTVIIPFILSKKNINILLKEKSKDQRVDFYENILNTWRWRLLFKLFFSKKVMGALGRDPEFFKYAESNVADSILERSKYALINIPTHENPYLEYILKGNFINCYPHYLKESNFDIIKKNIDNLEIIRCNINDALKLNKNIKFDGFNLSDIFEYMNYENYLEEIKNILKHSNHGARLVYWNMMVKRETEGKFCNQIITKREFAFELYRQNKAFFYNSLVIEEVK